MDARRHARNSTIKAEDTVLVKQKKKSKYTTMFWSQLYKVIEVRHSRVTAQRGDHVITRNISHFKKYSRVNGDTIVLGHESEDDVTLTEPRVERNNDQNNDQNRIEHRYPLRIKDLLTVVLHRNYKFSLKFLFCDVKYSEITNKISLTQKYIFQTNLLPWLRYIWHHRG